MHRNIFIDLGSHYGKIIARFMASPLYKKNFEIIAFEANPLLPDSVFSCYPSIVRIIRKAAWIYDGEIKFYMNRNRPNIQGHSVCKNKITGQLDQENPVIIPCIDFSAWLRSNFNPQDNIIVKSNIEGAEYELFDWLIADGTASYIKRLFLRRHWAKIGMPKEVDDDFLARLSKSIPVIENEYRFV